MIDDESGFSVCNFFDLTCLHIVDVNSRTSCKSGEMSRDLGSLGEVGIARLASVTDHKHVRAL